MEAARKPRVIIADDEPHIRILIKTVMTSMNTEVVGEAKNGQEAVDLYRREKPDLALFDINMPIKNGEEALKEVISEFPEAFIIMLTSVADMETVNRCLDLGAANYLLKDTPLADMKKMIQETWTDFKRKKE